MAEEDFARAGQGALHVDTSPQKLRFMQVLKFNSETDWTVAVAALWRDRMRANPWLRMCLPAGHTPVPIFAAMAGFVRQGQISFRDAEVIVLDEFGGLGPGDPGRCSCQVRHGLVDHVDLPSAHFHFIQTEAPDLAAECRRYDAVIGRGFDLTLLGVGPNGHLGMNEPGSSPERTTHRTELHASTIAASRRYLDHERTPTWGVTVGLKQLLESREVWLLARGAAKAEIVRRTMEGDVTTDVPASLLRRHPNCKLFVDAAAGAALPV